MSERNIPRGWGPWLPVALLIAVLFLGAFAVPIAGPIRSSSVRLLIALAILLLGLGLATIVQLIMPDNS